jgi:hypothetical protein
MIDIDVNKYDLIAIGEFSYGFQEIWELRYEMLQKLIRSTNKNITIFCEIYDWQAYNLNNKLHDDINGQNCDDVLFSQTELKYKSKSPKGELYQYMPYLIESKIFYAIIKYISKHYHRINIVGIRPDETKSLNVDEYMFENITRNLNLTHINFLWAHNCYVDNRKSLYNHKEWSCGHKLKHKYGNNYCIILSQSHKGQIRWDSFYLGHSTKKHIWEKHHFYTSFNFYEHKKWSKFNKIPYIRYHIYRDFNGTFIEFADGYYEDRIFGHDNIIKVHNVDYLIFWNNVSPLVPMRKY